MAIQIRSFNQILGDMIRKIISDTPLNDLNAGSVLLTLLEAAAANDFENNTAILNVLELLNIDAVKNNDLDAKAGDFGLTRQVAVRSSGFVNILNTNITKRSTGLYTIKPAPIAGQTKIYVNNTDGWSTTGSLYIGRGTENFEGPINYTITNVYATYTEITLGSSLQKDHLISDVIIDSQGEPDRIIGAGTLVKIPANSQNPEIQYVTLRDAIIPAGEDIVTDVDVIALDAGSQGNASIGTITDFDSPPFTGAAITNTTSFSNGKDVETDTQLRNRIKSYSITLARGTAPSIISALIGVSDPDDSKQIASAILTEPITVGDPSVMYIDDGYGFQPSYTGQSVDSLLRDAKGTEEFLQLANYPLPRPQVVNTDSGPFNVQDGSLLKVMVDGTEETVYFSTSHFLNISAATLSEVIVAINDQSSTFKARFTDNSKNILIYPVAHDAETIQVVELKPTDNPTLYVNSLLKFPTDEFSHISLYQNSTRLREKVKNAELTTTPYAQWNITSDSNIIISVDGTPSQDQTFALSDFLGSTTFEALTLSEWVDAFNKKFAGMTAIATPSETMVIKSNKTGSASSIYISGGTLLSKWFANLPTESQGQESQFELNRQTGNLRVLTTIAPGDNITAGVQDAKGFALSNATLSGTYDLSDDSVGRPAEIIIVPDSTYCNRISLPLGVGTTISITNPSMTPIMRIMSSSLETFASVKPGDFIYIAKRTSGWLSDVNTGLFKVKAKGHHITAGSDSFLDVYNMHLNTIGQSNISVVDSLDIKAFETDGYPQIWRGSYLTTPAAESINGIINSLNKDTLGILATAYKSNSIKITSSTESNGSIAIPIAVGNALNIFAETQSANFGNAPHIATRVSDKSLITGFKMSPSTYDTFLDRHAYTDIKATLSSNFPPDSAPFTGTYSEQVESVGILNSSNVEFNDYLSFTRGNNKGQLRTVKAEIAGDIIGTQQSTARTEINHIIGDELELVKPISISSDDSIVVIMDKDSVAKTIDVRMSRTGRVNAGSGSGSFIPTTTELSAFDEDNEPNIDFNNVNVWGTTINNTNFSDYAMWMRSRNWYSTNGVAGTDGKMLVRSAQYGPNGEKIRFNIKYPDTANQSPTTLYTNTPSWSEFSYVYGSGAAKATALNPSYTVTVNGPYPDDTTNFPTGATSSGNYYDYTFSGGDLSTVVIGDILSITDGSGFSGNNSGQFRVTNKSGYTVRLFNPNAVVSIPGAPEITTITTPADILGTPTEYSVTTVADVGGSLHQMYFLIDDTVGTVCVWYDINNIGATPPIVSGITRYIKISTVITNDSQDDVAAKTASTLALDSAFSTSSITNIISVVNTINGPTTGTGSGGSSGFGVSKTVSGAPNNSIDGRYFIMYDQVGSVAVWYDVDNNGTLEPSHGADRSIKITGVVSGDTADAVAAATAVQINSDLSFAAYNVGDVITITNSFDGNVSNAHAYSSFGIIISVADGVTATFEAIGNADNVVFFSLIGTDVATICSTVNTQSILELTPIGSDALTITKSTYEEDYVYTDNSTALGYGHNPTSSSLKGYIALYDGVNCIKSFQNTNPNFTMKRAFTLNNVAPSVYEMSSAPNTVIDSSGELFKLIPVTVQNVYHQLTQKALSQLPIVANIKISNDRKNVQISSKSLGSSGAIEIVGGNGNNAKAYIIGESEISTDMSGSYLLTKIPAFPDTFNTGDYIKITNDTGVKRLSRLKSTDTIDVTSPSSSYINYNFNPKVTNINAYSQFSIRDVSSLYFRSPGTVWRWSHGLFVTLAQVNAGDQVMAFGSLSASWDQGNKARTCGNNEIAGLPIVAVNDSERYFDVVNPNGKAMPMIVTSSGVNVTAGDVYSGGPGVTFTVLETATGAGDIKMVGDVPVGGFSSTLTKVSGSGSPSITVMGFSVTTVGTGTVQVCPTPTIKWNLAHAARVKLSSIQRTTNTVTVTCSNAHMLNTLDSVNIIDSDYLTDGNFGPITVTSASTFTFHSVGSDFNESATNASILKTGTTATKYRLEKLGFNDLVRISCASGESPRFAECGVAVDDYVIVKGETFSANNNGKFRILAVDDDSIIIENPSATEELNTLQSFNNKGLLVTWTTNTRKVMGVAGSFKNLNIGDWVKKKEDPDSYYRQVISFSTGSADTATYIILGSNYVGTTDISAGVSYDQLIDYDKGVVLQGNDDITVLEGDSTIVGDTLSIQNIINTNWFSPTNIGSFEITTIGTDPNTYKPFIRINNSIGVTESSRSMSVDTSGLYIVESLANKFSTIRQIKHTALDDANSQRRSLYLAPANRAHKFSETNATSITHMGKLGYNTDVTTGIDGYLYYTGLLRRAQRIIDGYEPDQQNFPGRRAVGASIEILPPLIRKIAISVDITTNEGVNLGDITNNIKSVVINYIQTLGVGEDVILSQIIAEIMKIKGIAAVTFVTPTPSTERITIASNEKATIEPSSIGIA